MGKMVAAVVVVVVVMNWVVGQYSALMLVMLENVL